MVKLLVGSVGLKDDELGLGTMLLTLCEDIEEQLGPSNRNIEMLEGPRKRPHHDAHRDEAQH